MLRQEASGSPQRSQTGGVMSVTRDQQAGQTHPRVGASSTAPHAAHGAASSTDSIASTARRAAFLDLPVSELDPLRPAPEAFEAVELACLRGEDMDDEVEVVEQDPVGIAVALDV